MNTELLEEILSCPSLPSLPTVAMRVVELTQDPGVSMRELAETIQVDQGLAAKVLRTVNSSFYGLPKRCGSIEKALVMLGLRPVKSLALGFSLVECVGTEECEGFDYASYWRRGLYAATAARFIAHRVCRSQEEEAFVAGLFEDIGMVAMHRALGGRYVEVMQKAGGRHDRLTRQEVADLEVQHAEVGAMLAQRWKLPDELVIPIQYHERPTAAPVEWGPLCRCVGLANLVHDVLTVDEAAASLRRLYQKAETWFDLRCADVDAILVQASEASHELASILRLDAGARSDAEAILRAANEQLIAMAAEEQARPRSAVEFAGLTIEADRIDPLTGLLQRGAFESVLARSFSLGRTSGESVTLVQVHVGGIPRAVTRADVDAADQTIITVTALLRKHFEPMGAALCRWAGDTFAAAVVGAERTAVARTAGEFRADLERSSDHLRAGVTVSIGVAVADSGTIAHYASPQQLVASALAAANAARQAGGNCVRTFVPRAAA